LVNRKNLAQLVLSSNDIIHNVYVDNVYFYKKTGGGTVTEPTEAAPTPSLNADDVISLFSDGYTNVTVDTWRTDWSSATLEAVTVAGNPTKKYSDLDFVGIETLANPIDVTGMTHFHIDVWSADFTFFGIKLVDFGADGAYDGGDDVEHQVNFNTPQQGEWINYDIPLNDFTNLTTKEHMAQYILVGERQVRIPSISTIYTFINKKNKSKIFKYELSHFNFHSKYPVIHCTNRSLEL